MFMLNLRVCQNKHLSTSGIKMYYCVVDKVNLVALKLDFRAFQSGPSAEYHD